ncbi:alpha/beta hydrolase-fold protein [Cocleimonas sp. KMM 6892]|uniref:alpha/beta hydrolase n=1 Tax=unclassified Cocleimonas TaxID=2639732 RepID=UPI002DBD2FFD|nr:MULTISPECIES: alpha/beta hydrolase-fold protein [unclassified Cocleimonas]MEB8432023.1 alpha/beta hydrolase-fold protein [Cocleimonas sp. KMM 6892]MEC4714891.1 alpha/beta hydrolase-fold protein [Cocleimonas sp. KMM 6895]MEC4744295.1 alpha/beta hydrolase-fold protein [Cocleimonas sp. KMM 6896]
MPNYHNFIRLMKQAAFIGLFVVQVGCSSFKGTELAYEKIPTSSLDKTIEYGVYTPPNWIKTERLPLVLFLHGARDDHNTLEQYKTHRYFDEQINADQMPRFILVTPNGGKGFWENWYDGSHNYRDWVMQDILPKVQKDYNTLDCPEHCSLMGISMGGFGALRMASIYKNSFSSLSAISTPVLSNENKQDTKVPLLVRLFFPLKRIFGPKLYNGDESQSIRNVWSDKNNVALQKIRLQLIWGDKDQPNIIRSNQSFHELLQKSGREHEYFIYDGGHKWVDWQPNFNRVINFLLK